MGARQAYSWGPEAWPNQVADMRPSSGGAQGVIFVWDRTASLTGPASFVIKPLSGGAAPAKFAEFMLDKVGGAASPESQPIERRSPKGEAIVMLLQRYMKAVPSATDEDRRWQSVFRYYDGAQTFLLQEMQSGITEMAEAYREQHGLRQILRNATLMRNLGKLFAADAVIGNGDRLCQVNSGNIIFKPDGTLSSIDSTTVLTNYQALLADTKLSRADLEAEEFSTSPQAWAKNMIQGHQGQVASSAQAAAYDPLDPSSKKPVLSPGFTMKLLFDVDRWWTLHFRGHLEAGVNQENRERAKQQLLPVVPPRDSEWNDALASFKAGLDEGLAAADEWMSGWKWLQIKAKYAVFVARFGSDPNLDWTSFKVRRVYYKARRAGASEGEAMAAVEEYVARKFSGV